MTDAGQRAYDFAQRLFDELKDFEQAIGGRQCA
jgi:hypothetical protein